jgi:hypothetical protein
MLVLACESRATQIIHTLNRDLAPMTGAYFDTLRQAGTKELIPWLGMDGPLRTSCYHLTSTFADPYLSILNTTFAHSNPIVEVDGHYLMDFKQCRELAEQINSITEYSPPPVSAEIRQDVLEYVEYNLQQSLAVKASSAAVVRSPRLARKERSTITRRETKKSTGELRAPPQGRMDTSRRREGQVAPRRGDVGRRRGGFARRHEEDTTRRREEKTVRQREEMVRRREEMARQREEKMTRRREEKMVRQREEMARRSEEDMARWRKDLGRWRKDMARWRKDTTRWREDSALRGGGDLEGVPDEDTSVEPRRRGLKSRLLSFFAQKL